MSFVILNRLFKFRPGYFIILLPIAEAKRAVNRIISRPGVNRNSDIVPGGFNETADITDKIAGKRFSLLWHGLLSLFCSGREGIKTL